MHGSVPSLQTPDESPARAGDLAIPLRRKTRFGQALPRTYFVESLAEVASVVSSRRSTEEVLRRVVDEAKAVVRCRKALLLLFPDDMEGPVSASSVLVRGSRAQYPETWWRSCIDHVAAEVCETGSARLVEDRANDAALAVVPVRARDRTIGLLSAINSRTRSFSREQTTLLAVLGAFAAAAIENARLREQSEYALLAGERKRIAKEMHDGLAQSLFSASLALEVCKRRVRAAPDDVEHKLAETQSLLSESVAELRRYIYDLRPVSLERLGLPGAIECKLEEAERSGRVHARLCIVGHERTLTPSAETCLYRVTQEAVANVLKHAGAENLQVSVTYGKDNVELLVEDDGVGFEPEAALERAEHGESLGLRSMRDRVAAEGGRIRVASTPGGVTSVWVDLPC